MTRAVISYGPVPSEPRRNQCEMSADLGGTWLPNPVMTASGCAASGKELEAFFDLRKIGAVVTKSIMLAPRSGRATPRMAETPSGMLNSIGLQGPGIDSFLENDLSWLQERGIRTVVSIAGSTVDEFTKLAQRLRHVPDVTAIEVNISCPNVENRGLVFSRDAETAAAVIANVRRNTQSDVPVIAKLSPDVTDIVEVATACARAGANALALINTTLGMVINTDTMRPHLAGVTGGLSGPAIRPIAVRCVWEVHQALPQLPIVGMGGIRTGLDALQFILAGASTVSVGTATFNDPAAPARVLTELSHELSIRGFERLIDAVGLAHHGAGEIEPVDQMRESGPVHQSGPIRPGGPVHQSGPVPRVAPVQPQSAPTRDSGPIHQSGPIVGPDGVRRWP